MSAPRSLSPAAIGVFALIVAIGGAGLYTVSGTSRQPERAVAGSPSAPRGGVAPTGMDGELPAGHPSIEMPAEVVELLDDLAAKAEAAPDDVEAWQRLARARYRAGMLDRSYVPGAIEAADHLLGIAPDNLEAIRTRGNIAYDTGNYEEATKYFGRYLELDAEDPGVRTDLASAKLFLGETAEARAMYEAVLEDHPDFLQAHVNLGIALHAERREDEAMQHFARARELASTPEQKQRVDEILAMAKQRAGGGAGARTAAAAPAGDGARPATASEAQGTGASSEFQREVEQALRQHSIVGPKVASIDWKDTAAADVRLAGFPMDRMPPVVRNKFKSKMNELIATAAQAEGVDAAVKIDLVDAASGRVMDSLDGKEWVGAFDEQNYE